MGGACRAHGGDEKLYVLVRELEGLEDLDIDGRNPY
jgi:hypothetical protein